VTSRKYPLSSARGVRHEFLREGKNRRNAVNMANVEQHSFGDLAGHVAWLKVDDKQGLPTFDLGFRVSSFAAYTRRYRPLVISENAGQP
jgi:hypothetical protein